MREGARVRSVNLGVRGRAVLRRRGPLNETGGADRLVAQPVGRVSRSRARGVAMVTVAGNEHAVEGLTTTGRLRGSAPQGGEWSGRCFAGVRRAEENAMVGAGTKEDRAYA